MIPLTNEQIEKITLLDKLLETLSVEQLRELAESEQIVSKLKGTGYNNSLILMTLIQEHQTLMSTYENNNSQLRDLKTDFQALLRVLQTVFSASQHSSDFLNLKNRHCIY